MPINTKREKIRLQTVRDYLSGKPVEFNINPKGLYELQSTDGITLYFYDYPILKKSNIKINNKPVLFWNVNQYVPFGEYGTPCSQQLQHLRYNILQELKKDGAFKNYEVIYLGHDKDMEVIDLSGYVQEYTQLIYALLKKPHTWSMVYKKETYFVMWKGCFHRQLSKAISLLKHLNLSTGVSTSYKNLQDIHKNVKARWAVVNEVLKYWIANGLKFKNEDDNFVSKASMPIRSVYNALGGKQPQIKDVNREAGILLLRVMSPETPLEEIPLYISVEDETVKDVVKQRLAIGI